MTRKNEPPLSRLPALKRSLLLSLKRAGPATIARLAAETGVTREAVRQQLVELTAEGLAVKTTAARGVGRPTGTYGLAPAAEPLFPKAYDELAVELLDAAADELGPAALKKILARMAAERVRRWLPAMKGKSLAERVRVLRGVYRDGDPFMRAEAGDPPRLVETNCPFFAVASKRPALCSMTVSTLSRLLGRRVTRAERFQNGDGRCAFLIGKERVRADAPFVLED